MIVWLRLLFVWRGSILPQLLAALGFAVLVTLVHGQVWRWKVPLNFVPFSLIGLTLAIFLGFRNSTSYSRWWEARVLWGQLLIASRAAVRQALTLVDAAGRCHRAGAPPDRAGACAAPPTARRCRA